MALDAVGDELHTVSAVSSVIWEGEQGIPLGEESDRGRKLEIKSKEMSHQ